MNFTGLLRAPINWQVFLKRKACLNDNQTARRKVAYVRAPDKDEAKRIALLLPENAAFIADGQPKEVR